MGFSTFFVSEAEEESPYLSRATIKEYDGAVKDPQNTPLMKGWTVAKFPTSEFSGLKISNQLYTVIYGENGKIKEVHRFFSRGDKTSKQLFVTMDYEFLSYSTHRSGAYLFLPNGPANSIRADCFMRVVEVSPYYYVFPFVFICFYRLLYVLFALILSALNYRPLGFLI